ncbi:MAG: Gfo/Idh/MocA family oxidoreductase [Gammaproteobacteria bacterium]|nr:Gfo/Idh/MocA family oxidoreductase [Gammaproteobacteria bacterium]MCI0591688.1 Gfo/Idh/MocA family oxidoreductase [Gammaproteobacteria bacterium]
MAKITTAVIGVGYLGKFHAEKYAQLPDSKLVAVVDTNRRVADAVASKYHVESSTDYRELLGRVQAVSIVVPTSLHYDIAKAFIKHDSHVLVEKPITTTIPQADDLISLARTRRKILQVGHLERFNAAILNLDKVRDKPVFIETHRLASFNPRGTDVNVVLDLMIHDIDIIINLVKSDLVRIDATGASILSDAVDIANARLVFKNGCVANVTASRVSMKTERKMRLFQRDSYVSIDFQNRVVTVHKKGNGEMFPGIPNIDSEQTTFEDGDALKTEIALFLEAIRSGTQPVVSGEDGKRALQTAIQITELLNKSPLTPA